MPSNAFMSPSALLRSASFVLLLEAESVYAGTTRLVPSQYATIQAAINAAANGDVVLLAPGLYKEPVTITNKSITLASEFHTTGDRSYIDQTIIDGKATGWVVRVQPTLIPTIVGLTLQNGSDGVRGYGKFRLIDSHITNTADGVDYEGGSGGLIMRTEFDLNSDDGIDVDNDVSAYILDNTIHDNGDDGIEIRLQPFIGPRHYITIQDNSIERNGEDGIQLISSNVATPRTIRIEGNLILDNAMAGIGMMCCENTVENYSGANILERVGIYNNTIAGNDHGITGGDSVLALNNLIVNSTRIGMKNVNAGSVTAYNLIHGNGTNVATSNVDTLTTLFADPFIRPDRSIPVYSPGFDAGTAAYEQNGEVVWERDPSAYWGLAPEIGAIENQDVLAAPGAGASDRIVFSTPVPNPSTGTTRFHALLPTRGHVRLEIVDVHGRRVRRIHDGVLAAGPAEWTWDGRSDAGAKLGPGVYFARLQTPAGLHSRRVVKLH